MRILGLGGGRIDRSGRRGFFGSRGAGGRGVGRGGFVEPQKGEEGRRGKETMRKEEEDGDGEVV